MPLGGVVATAEVSTTIIEGVRFVLLDHPGYFDREHLYGEGGQDYADNAERFAFLSRGALEWAATQPRYDVIHAHDWQTGLVPAYQKLLYATHAAVARARTVMTVHNIAFQGQFPASVFGMLGLPAQAFAIDGVEYYGSVGYLKGGLAMADSITTVSPAYAQEICTPEYGMGLDGLLRARRHVLRGIVNGIDTAVWDPESDTRIAGTYSAKTLNKRAANKRALEARFKLEPGVVEWVDLIRGAAHIDCGALSDPVLIRADGTFLYTLPSVVATVPGQSMGATN